MTLLNAWLFRQTVRWRMGSAREVKAGNSITSGHLLTCGRVKLCHYLCRFLPIVLRAQNMSSIKPCTKITMDIHDLEQNKEIKFSTIESLPKIKQLEIK
mgnify:CR=1 FL=1